MQAVNNEPDYLVLYGQCRRKIAHLETQINKMVAKHNKEVETLKKELADLKAAYERDMALISSDIQTLNSQISPSDPQ